MGEERRAGRGERGIPWKRVALAALLAAPLALTPLAGRAFADRIALAAGPRLAAIGEALLRAPSDDARGLDAWTIEPEGIEASGSIADADPSARYPGIEGARRPARSTRERSGEAREEPAPRRGILVRSDVVARAVRSGARPTGAPVAASGMRPGGVALRGISGFGSGLRDGDVVTAVGGTATTSVGMVIAAVAGAVRSHAKAISAVIWRDQQEIRVTIELPRISRRALSDP